MLLLLWIDSFACAVQSAKAFAIISRHVCCQPFCCAMPLVGGTCLAQSCTPHTRAVPLSHSTCYMACNIDLKEAPVWCTKQPKLATIRQPTSNPKFGHEKANSTKSRWSIATDTLQARSELVSRCTSSQCPGHCHPVTHSGAGQYQHTAPGPGHCSSALLLSSSSSKSCRAAVALLQLSRALLLLVGPAACWLSHCFAAAFVLASSSLSASLLRLLCCSCTCRRQAHTSYCQQTQTEPQHSTIIMSPHATQALSNIKQEHGG